MLQTVILILLDICLVVGGQFCMKFGMNKIGSFTTMPIKDFVVKAFTSPLVLLGILLYVISTVVWLMVLSKVDLSFAYPMLSFGYVLVLLVSWGFLGESINIVKIAGIMLICGGIICIFRS